MSLDSEAGPTSGTALERARAISQTLAEAARRARLSSRSRRGQAGGFQARRGQALFRWFVILSFWLVVAIPAAATTIYYAFIAADQFVAEAQFTVQGGDIPVADSIGKLTGLPALSIVQDTMIVTNFIHSRAAIEQLDERVGLRALYATSAADAWARFASDRPIEKFQNYWEGMADVSIKMPSGIVVLKIKAFTAQDAARIAEAVLETCERLINEMNDRMHRDAVSTAEQEFERTAARVKDTRIALEQARNERGILDAGKAGEAVGKLINELRSFQLRLQQEYASQLRGVSAGAPQMRALKTRLDAVASQIADLEAKVTTGRGSSGAGVTLAASMTKFAELDLEHQIAQRLYTSAAASLEFARLTAEHKTMYLNTFVRPTPPQEALFPRRLLYAALTWAICFSAWGVLVGLVTLVRNHMA